MFAACHLTLLDHEGGSGDAVTDDHVGSPDRLFVLPVFAQLGQLRSIPD